MHIYVHQKYVQDCLYYTTDNSSKLEIQYMSIKIGQGKYIVVFLWNGMTYISKNKLLPQKQQK